MTVFLMVNLIIIIIIVSYTNTLYSDAKDLNANSIFLLFYPYTWTRVFVVDGSLSVSSLCL